MTIYLTLFTHEFFKNDTFLDPNSSDVKWFWQKTSLQHHLYTKNKIELQSS